MLIAAGASPKVVQTAVGHGSIAITMDRYGHLFPNAVDELRTLLDGYLG